MKILEPARGCKQVGGAEIIYQHWIGSVYLIAQASQASRELMAHQLVSAPP